MSMFSEHNRIKDRIGRIELRHFFPRREGILGRTQLCIAFHALFSNEQRKARGPKGFLFLDAT